MHPDLIFIALVLTGAFLFMLPLLLFYLIIIWLTEREMNKRQKRFNKEDE